MKKFAPRICSDCGELLGEKDYLKTKSPFFPDGRLSMCSVCLSNRIEDENDWNAIDRICQWADWPFMPNDWTRLCKGFGVRAIEKYGAMFWEEGYQGKVNWCEVNEEWLKLQEEGLLYHVHEELEQSRQLELQKKWGGNYTLEDLEYLEAFLADLNKNYSIVPGTQADQAVKLAKISLSIDQAIREGKDFDKIIKSYKEIIAIGGFTTKNMKNADDFETVGELFAYFERTGFENQFYDHVPKDIVDKTMLNIQNSLSRTIMGEANIQDEAQERLKALKLAELAESKIDRDVYDDTAYRMIDLDLDTSGSIDEEEYDEPPEEFDAGVE